MDYEKRLLNMGLKPFTKEGFLYHSAWQNENRKKAIEEIDKHKITNTYSVKDFMGLRLFKNGKTVYPVDPVLIVAKDDDILYVFNGHYTYSYNLNEYDGYEIVFEGERKIMEDDGEIL